MPQHGQGLVWSEVLCCSQCSQGFCHGREAVNLACSHAICRPCLAKLEQHSCPLDQIVGDTPPKSLPANSALMSILGVSTAGLEGLQARNKEEKRAFQAIHNALCEIASFLRRAESERGGMLLSEVLSRTILRKIVSLLCQQMVEDTSRTRAVRTARAIAERVLAEMLLASQNSSSLSAQLWTAVRARGCQFLGPAMQEDVLRLVLLALSKGALIARKTLVMYVVQTLSEDYPQVSKTCVGHVVQLLYRASCFNVMKREGESSLMQLKEEFRTYEALRREHDAQIVQMALEAGLRIAPEQWSALLYGDQTHRSHMQSIIDRLQTTQSFAAELAELGGSSMAEAEPTVANVARYLQPFLEIATNNGDFVSWDECASCLVALRNLVVAYAEHSAKRNEARSAAQQLSAGTRRGSGSGGGGQKGVPGLAAPSRNFKTRMCRDVAAGRGCPRGTRCTYAHDAAEMRQAHAVAAAAGGGGGHSQQVSLLSSMAPHLTGPMVPLPPPPHFITNGGPPLPMAPAPLLGLGVMTRTAAGQAGPGPPLGGPPMQPPQVVTAVMPPGAPPPGMIAIRHPQAPPPPGPPPPFAPPPVLVDAAGAPAPTTFITNGAGGPPMMMMVPRAGGPGPNTGAAQPVTLPPNQAQAQPVMMQMHTAQSPPLMIPMWQAGPPGGVQAPGPVLMHQVAGAPHTAPSHIAWIPTCMAAQNGQNDMYWSMAPEGSGGGKNSRAEEMVAAEEQLQIRRNEIINQLGPYSSVDVDEADGEGDGISHVSYTVASSVLDDGRHPTANDYCPYTYNTATTVAGGGKVMELPPMPPGYTPRINTTTSEETLGALNEMASSTSRVRAPSATIATTTTVRTAGAETAATGSIQTATVVADSQTTTATKDMLNQPLPTPVIVSSATTPSAGAMMYTQMMHGGMMATPANDGGPMCAAPYPVPSAVALLDAERNRLPRVIQPIHPLGGGNFFWALQTTQEVVANSIDRIVDVREATENATARSAVFNKQLQMELKIANMQIQQLDPHTTQTCLLKELEEVDRKIEEIQAGQSPYD